MNINIKISNGSQRTTLSFDIDNETILTKTMLNEIVSNITKGQSTMHILIVNTQTRDFYQYVFDYLENSKYSSRKWFFNNFLWTQQELQKTNDYNLIPTDLLNEIILHYQQC